MKIRITATLILLVLLIVAALTLSPGQKVLAEPPAGAPVQQMAPAP